MDPMVPKALTICTGPTGRSLRKEMDLVVTLKSRKRPPPWACLFLSSVFPFICDQTPTSFLQGSPPLTFASSCAKSSLS